MELRRLITFDGADSDFQYFSTPSWSRPDSEIIHEIVIDKRSGEIRCTCEDAVCRGKRGDVILKAAHVCKHIAELQKHIKAVMHAKEAA